ncbi:MAG: Uma2 family endonuclease [Cyanobacteria bacterium P01_A01_bin.83]
MYTLLNPALVSNHLRDGVTVSFAGKWSDFEDLCAQQSQGRISFLHNVITIMSPSFDHEAIAEILGDLVKIYCDSKNLVYYSMGSTTITNKPNAGKQPDASFSFQERKEIPDLAIEVIFTSGGLDDLEKYRWLGVTEVWMWKNQELTFYWLNKQNVYEKRSQSYFLTSVFASYLVVFANRALRETPLTIKRDFLARLNDEN